MLGRIRVDHRCRRSSVKQQPHPQQESTTTGVEVVLLSSPGSSTASSTSGSSIGTDQGLRHHIIRKSSKDDDDDDNDSHQNNSAGDSNDSVACRKLNDNSSIMSWGSANSLDSYIFVDDAPNHPHFYGDGGAVHDEHDDDVFYYDPYLDHSYNGENKQQERLRQRRLLQSPPRLSPPLGMMNNMDHSMATTFRSEDAGSGQAVLLASFDSTYRQQDGERRHSKRTSSRRNNNDVKVDLSCIEVPVTTTSLREQQHQTALQSITQDVVNLNVSGSSDGTSNKLHESRLTVNSTETERNSSRSKSRPRKHDGSDKSKKLQKALHERNYWNKVVEQRLTIYGGPLHLPVAEALMDLGQSHLRCGEASDALSVFKSATRIFRHLYGDLSLPVAKALVMVGAAASRRRTDLKAARVALKQALEIRHKELGANHVDTVDALNHLAGVHYSMKHYPQAKQAYKEVLGVRRRLFGGSHPSVAITAQALGGLCVRLQQLEEASSYYEQALEIYEKLGLTSSRNPAVKKLSKERARLERLQRCDGLGKNILRPLEDDDSPVRSRRQRGSHLVDL